MPRTVLKLGLATTAVLLALLATQWGGPLIYPRIDEQLLPLPYRQDDLARIANEETYLRFHPQLGWTIGAATARAAGDVEYRSNAAGFRAHREYSTGYRDTGPRLAAFGDSFTHCDEVQYDECWTYQLERDWDGTEVLNFGVPGYSPDQAWLAYRLRADDYKPCGVLIGYMVENINRVVNRYRPFYEPETGIRLSKPRFTLENDQLKLVPNPAASPTDLADPDWVERNLGPGDHWYYPGMFAGSALDVLVPVRLVKTIMYRAHLQDPRYRYAADDTRQLELAYSSQGEAFQIASRVLVEFAREIKRDGRTPVVVIFGRKDDIVAQRQRRDAIYEPLLDVLDREGVPTIDVTPTLGRLAREVGTLPLVDKHYRKRAHAEIGRLLDRRLPEMVSATCQRAS